MRFFKITLLASSMLATNVYASNHFYINVGAGVVTPSGSSSYTSNSNTIQFSPTAIGTSLFTLPNVTWKNSFNTGFDANVAFGYQFMPNWRSDIEFTYQNMKRNINGSNGWIEQYASTGAVYARSSTNPISHSSSTANVYSFLTNAYFDFKNQSKWTPTLGGGIGIAWMNSDSTTSSNTLNVDDPTTPLVETAPVKQVSASLTGTAFAWQIKAGVAYEASSTTSVILQYRLFGTSQFKASSSSITTNPGAFGQTLFYVNPHNVAGLLTNALELNVRFNV